MDHHSAGLLLLLLTCLTGFSTSDTGEDGTMGENPYGPSSLEIDGVSVVTVGIPYYFQCKALCFPGCKYSWTRGNVTTQGPVLSLQLLHTKPTETLTCTVVNPATGKSASVQKTMQVTAGPSDIRISGPTFLTSGVKSNFSCLASCYPSCSYRWTISWYGETLQTFEGDTVSFSPYTSTIISESLTCEAEDTVSHLYISTTLTLPVASVSGISIEGDTTVTMGQTYTFTCIAACIPTCSFTWKYMGTTYQGDRIEIPILHEGDKKKFASYFEITLSDYSKIEPLTCVATNSISHASLNSTVNLTVIDPISVNPTSKDLPVAGKSFSLQCDGSQNPASITWLKNKQPMPASGRVHFTPDNVTMTFGPLLQADDGLYQCVVAQGGPLIQSVGYKMQVNYGPSSVVISGVDVMTLGMPYEFQCSASCYPTCQFSWTWGKETSQGPKLSLQLVDPAPTLNLACTAVNPATETSVTTQKMLQVIVGPTNIHVSGPAFLTAGVTSNLTCSADCHPSCSFSWLVTWMGETLITAQGSTLSVTLPANNFLSDVIVTCKAQETVSHLDIEKSLQLQLASLSNITITGDSAVAIGKQYTYECFADCTPSCDFTWTFMGKPFENDRLDLTISDYSKIEPLTCEATNTLSNATITATMNLTVTDPFSVRPTSQAPPVAGKPFSLQCLGPQQPADISWLKNQRQMPAYERVHFSPDNTTVTFSFLLREDDGLYQCLVVEGENRTIHDNTLVAIVVGGTPTLSVGYLMQVNYGPNEVLIEKPNEGPVGEVMLVQAGSTTELRCATDCFPVCLITWFYEGAVLSTNASISFTPVIPPYAAALSCMASNPVTGQNSSAVTEVEVPDGPTYVVITGPRDLEIGVTASFVCSADCSPSCSFKWTVYGQTMAGSVIDITVNRQVSKESISCQAENTFTGETATVNVTVSVSDPHWCGC
ncbi:cell adhesion molecule CEACAM5-like [Anarhichas minor]|uniref:cell adhesion molecule CEACAM5-like n=1 Tax=Anarhichas minor TaxID=65739 RepID=UPI003F738993